MVAVHYELAVLTQTPGLRQLAGELAQSGFTSRRLSEPQARIYQEWIANRRRLLGIIAEIDQISAQAAEILLSEADRGGPPHSTN